MDARTFLAPYADIAAQRRRALRVLDLPEEATRQALQQRFRQLALTHHPDRGGESAAFCRLVNAYLVLTRADPRGYPLEENDGDPPCAAPATEEEYRRWWLARFFP